MIAMPNQTHAVFSVATNGYDRQFKHCIESQKAYCQRLGVPYFLLNGRPPWGIAAHDSAWMKIFMLQYLLKTFMAGVLYLDADCEVTRYSEDFRCLDRILPGKSLFAANDFSNRLNGAVIYCRGTLAGRQLMNSLALSAWVPQSFLPRVDRNLYENGHFIWICKKSPHVHVLDQKWNSGLYRDVERPNIIHHGGDVMRELSGEKPLSIRSRLYAAWTGIRLPIHMAWYKHTLSRNLIH